MTASRTRLFLASALFPLLAGPALADAPKWTYVQAGYYQLDGYDSELDVQGLQLQGSIGFAERWHAQASWLEGDMDIDDENADLQGYRVSVGSHVPVTGDLQLVSDLFYFDIERDADDQLFVDGDTDGYGVGVGLRTVLADKVDLYGLVNWTSADVTLDDESTDYTDFGLSIIGRYNWTPAFSTGVQFNVNDSSLFGPLISTESAVIDLRWSFGADPF